MRAHLLSAYDAWIRYLDLPGDGPAHVYLAGLGSAATAEFPEIVTHPALAGRRSLLVDLVGSGWSDPGPPSFGYTVEEHAETVAELLDSLGLAGCVVVGHSLGGSVAIALAHTRPDLVGQLVACEPGLDPGRGTVSRHIASQSWTSFVMRGYDVLRATVEREERQAGESVFYATTGRWSPLAMYRVSVSLLADRDPTFRAQLIAAPMPRAVLVGERSDGADVTDLVAAGVKVHVVPGAGHAMASDNAAGFAKTLAAAIAAHADGREDPQPQRAHTSRNADTAATNVS
jgi:pimeloyl-ACP methyl ester carboxylesterase